MNQTFQAGANFNPSQGSFGSGVNVSQVNPMTAFHRGSSIESSQAANLPNAYLNRPPQYTADNSAVPVD